MDEQSREKEERSSHDTLPLSEMRREELKSRIKQRLQEKYNKTIAECEEAQKACLRQLQEEIRKQIDYSRYDAEEYRSLSIREILELERQGNQTT